MAQGNMGGVRGGADGGAVKSGFIFPILLHRGDDVVDQMLPLGVSQHVAKEIAGLRVVVVVARRIAVVPVR